MTNDTQRPSPPISVSEASPASRTPPSRESPTPPTRLKVILACQVFYPDAQSTSQLFTDLFHRLAQTGLFDLTVICGYPSALRVGSGRVSSKEVWNGIRIRRCGLRVDVKRNFMSRLLSYTSFLMHTFWKLLWTPRGAIVLGVTNPPFMAILLWLVHLVRFGKFHYVYNLQDLHPEGLIVTQLVRQSSLGTRLWTSLNRRAYQNAELLIVLGRDMIPVVEAIYDIPKERFRYIPHWSIITEAQPPPPPPPYESNRLARELGLQSKFVVQYSGNMGLWHDMQTFVRAAAELKEDNSIQFLFIGGGRERPAAEALSKALGLTNILWRDFAPREALAESLACCHISLVSLREGLAGVAVPCKIYGILACGRAILAQVPKESEVAMVVREDRCGRIVKPGDVEGLVAAIRSMKSHPAETTAMGIRGYAAYQKKYSLDQAAAVFTSLLNEYAT